MIKESLFKITATVLISLAVLTMSALAQSEEKPYKTRSQAVNDKAGSLLVYNYYTSSSCCDDKEETRVNITNTNRSIGIWLHMFFVDGSSCAVSDSFTHLTQNQTLSFEMGQIDPGISGYIVAVAVSEETGRPISFNFMIGNEQINLATGQIVDLGAVAFAVVDDKDGPLDPDYTFGSSTAKLIFDGKPGNYNRVPEILAISNLPSPSSAVFPDKNILMVINRIGGSLVSGPDTIGTVYGLLFNEAGAGLSFNFSSNTCQFRSNITSVFPRTTPRPNVHIPDGQSGWIKLYSTTPNVGYLGAVLINHVDAMAINAFNGGVNLHHLSLADTVTYVIPVFPPNA